MTRKKLKWLLVVMAVIAGVIGAYLPRHLFIALTPSVNYRLFWMSLDTQHLSTGDYVVFRLNRDRLQGLPLPTELAEDEDGIVLAVKRIGCNEGEILTRNRKKGREFYCGEQFLGRAKEKTRHGKPLQPAQVEGVIPPGMVFLVGDNKDSFDSRYFGLLDKESFVSKANGIF